MNWFAQRKTSPPDIYSYVIPHLLRNRLLHTMRLCLESQEFNNYGIAEVFVEMQDKLLQRYGGLRQPVYVAARVTEHPVVEHFFQCTDEEAMEFIRMCFETRWNFGRQKMVEAINHVLQEENIGYELTDYTETVTEGATLFGRFSPSAKTIHPTLPKIIRKDDKLLHADTVKPCLEALSDPRFSTASDELLNAFDEYRQGKYSDAVTDAGAAFESVLKIICTIKGWAYDKEKDTCSKLLDICREKGLFHGFYRPILEGVATVRNKTGDAHGKGPKAEYQPTKEIADHMMYMVCNNINLLTALAKL